MIDRDPSKFFNVKHIDKYFLSTNKCVVQYCNLLRRFSRKNQKNTKKYFCVKHFRFMEMIIESRKGNNKIPTVNELESMFKCLINFGCMACGQTMRWLRSEDNKKVITLQHDRSGKLRFLCQSCNSKHHYYDGDIYYRYAKRINRKNKTLDLWGMQSYAPPR